MVSESKKERLLRQLLSGKRSRNEEKQLSLSPESVQEAMDYYQQNPSLPKIFNPPKLNEMQLAHLEYQREKAANQLAKQPYRKEPPQKIPKLEKRRILLGEDGEY